MSDPIAPLSPDLELQTQCERSQEMQHSPKAVVITEADRILALIARIHALEAALSVERLSKVLQITDNEAGFLRERLLAALDATRTEETPK